nr:immunoglobulin heavy chain junction region [Mus musculus]MBK4187893.1 immunoglobulin heavy chain junction region [Mus musculus]MBK4187895.1 immunoglobulin heavy chain junction region [Mus musculus]
CARDDYDVGFAYW